MAVAKRVLQEPEWAFLAQKKITISVALVSEAEMQRLNKQCRRKDSVTDILSFAEYEKTGKIKKAKDPEINLGELVLCYPDIKKYAKQEKKNLRAELATVVAHGLLHLLGLAHGRKMFVLQDKATKKI